MGFNIISKEIDILTKKINKICQRGAGEKCLYLLKNTAVLFVPHKTGW